MENITDRINNLNWQLASQELSNNGLALVRSAITIDDCEELIYHYNNQQDYRKTVTMERYRFGMGEYKYFRYPLPDLIQTIRHTVYPKIAPVANRWMEVLKINTTFPDTFSEFQNICHAAGQKLPSVLILKYGPGGHNTLHQDLYGEVFFPIQLVLFLSQPGTEYAGGEFVLTQQTPRAQSKVIVFQPNKGDMLLFTTNFRPVKGNSGYHRVNMKHGVSPVSEGSRYTLGIIFHDALS